MAELRTWKHQELIDDLVRTLDFWRSIVITEQPAGSRWFQDAPIPDVMVIDKSYTRTNVRIFEVKVTQSDFRQDVTSQKYTRYLPLCDRFYFAVPLGIKWQELLVNVPAAGVMVRGEKGWKVARRCSKDAREPQDEMFWQSLLFGMSKKVGEANQRRTELETSKDYLRTLKKVRKNITEQTYGLEGQIAKRHELLLEREHAVERREQDVERELVKKLRDKLDVPGWRESVKEMLADLILKDMQHAGEQQIDKLCDFILAETKTPAGAGERR